MRNSDQRKSKVICRVACGGVRPAASGVLRALDMLQAKLRGEAFVTEVPMHAPERVTPAMPIADLSRATMALVTTGGLVRKGNPDRQVASNATRYYRHTVAELRSLSGKTGRRIILAISTTLSTPTPTIFCRSISCAIWKTKAPLVVFTSGSTPCRV